MFESARRSLGYQLARFTFRSKRDESMTFTGSLAASKRILLVLPLLPTQHSTGPIIELLRARYGENNITVVADARDSGITALMPRTEILRISAEQVTRLFHPPAALLERMSGKKFDAAIDLNLDFLLPSGYICKASGARVRVGFARPDADLFYNMQVQTGGTHGSGVYERLATCLKMF
jgi:hypothetical protein